METFNQNNIVKIGGTVANKLEFSHEVFEEKFYKFNMDVERLSGSKDSIPVIISERLINVNNFDIGKLILVEGQFRSHNQNNDGRNKLVLSVFVKEIQDIDLQDSVKSINEASLTGYICKKPIYRKTPLGREIADILVAVNRSYKKSDYIPCILWGRNAKYCENIEVGATVRLSGRIQAREYEKKNEDGTVKKMVAYEVSVAKFSLVDEKSKTQENIDAVEVNENIEE